MVEELQYLRVRKPVLRKRVLLDVTPMGTAEKGKPALTERAQLAEKTASLRLVAMLVAQMAKAVMRGPVALLLAKARSVETMVAEALAAKRLPVTMAILVRTIAVMRKANA
jgi:hypothetical protein